MKIDKLFFLWRKIINYKYINAIFTVIYTILLYFAYLVFIQKGVNIYYKTDLNWFKLFISILGIILIYILNKNVKNKYVKFFTTLFYYLMFIPISLIYCGKDYNNITYFAIIFQFAIMYLTINIIYKIFQEKKQKGKKAEKQIKYRKILSNIIYILFLINTLITLGACLYYNGIPGNKAIDLSQVYEVREEFYLPKYFNYLFTFETQFILIFLMILYLDKKNYAYTIITILLQFLFFLWKGDKVTLMSIPLSLGVYYLFKKHSNNSIKYMQFLWIILMLLSMFSYKISRMIYGIFVMRLCIAPANLKFIYFNFFQNHEKIGIMGTSINAIIKQPNPYIMNYQNEISKIYFNKPEMYSNTGFLAEGFARFGWIGVIIIPILMGIILEICTRKIDNKNKAFIMGISILPIMSLNDKFLLSSLTFGSLLCLVVVLCLFDKDDINIKPSNYYKIKQKIYRILKTEGKSI